MHMALQHSQVVKAKLECNLTFQRFEGGINVIAINECLWHLISMYIVYETQLMDI